MSENRHPKMLKILGCFNAPFSDRPDSQNQTRILKANAPVVIGNRLIGNGQPGVAMHAHKRGAILTGNLVTGNYIAKNGADVADNATPGPTGIMAVPVACR
jgi:hypothetical protein